MHQTEEHILKIKIEKTGNHSLMNLVNFSSSLHAKKSFFNFCIV